MSINDMIIELWTNPDISDKTIARIVAALRAGQELRDRTIGVVTERLREAGFPQSADYVESVCDDWDLATGDMKDD